MDDAPVQVTCHAGDNPPAYRRADLTFEISSFQRALVRLETARHIRADGRIRVTASGSVYVRLYG
ncbi:MAG: hypothetical protein CFK52_15360, partial [Chloracidobacterium sp. CP2_5A]